MPLTKIVSIALAGLLAVLPCAAIAQDDYLDAEIEQARSGDLVRELHARANAEPPQTSSRHELCLFYHRRGMARFRLGDYPRAVEDLRLALTNNVVVTGNPGEWGNRWRIQVHLGIALRQSGDVFAAIEHQRGLAQEYRTTAPFSYHSALLQLAAMYSETGDFATAGNMLKEANDTIPRMRQDARLWAMIGMGHMYTNRTANASVFQQQGNHAEAERLRREALDFAEKSLAVQIRIRSRGHTWIDSATDSLASARTNLASALAIRGKYGEAEVHARAGLELDAARQGFRTIRMGTALGGVGNVKLQQGELAAAETYFRHALSAVEGSNVVPHSGSLAGRRNALASTLLYQGRANEALKLYNERDQGLRSDVAQVRQTGTGLVGWAYALHRTGQSERAASMLAGMVNSQLKRPMVDRKYLSQLRGVLGIALAASGKIAEALRAFQESIPELIRRDQDDAGEENTGFSRAYWQRTILEGYLELLAKLHSAGETVPGVDLIDEAFRIADIARGSMVQEAIAATAARAQLPDNTLADLARQESDAGNRIVALNKVLSYLATTREHEQRAKLVANVQADIERLRKERAQLRAQISKRYPEYAELTDPKPVGIAEARKALAAEEALVSLYINESESYVWTVTPDGRAAFRVIAVKREEVEKDVAELRRAVDFGDGNPARLRPFDLARAHKLYHTYFEPDAALWKDAQVLNVIAHGALGQIPFALLVSEAPKTQPQSGAVAAYADVPWLIRRVGVAQLPSASAFAALRRTPAAKATRQPFIGFGDPLFTSESAAGDRRSLVRDLAVRKMADPMEAQLSALAQGQVAQRSGSTPAMARSLAQAFGQLSALPDTADELREIASVLKADASRDVFLNRQATERNVKQTSLANRRVVAFATHGVAPGELTGLDQPALVLSNPALTGDSDNDGFLTMEEVLGLKLDADWVVLSACNTGSADGRGSEAVSGLGRAFFYAGARSLLVSNWAVETTSAKLLTTELFKRQAENPQLTRAEALRQSMLSLMGKNATGAATFSYAHPAFWAPFSLVGDGGR